jgi:putative DNA primase/helicase
MRPKQWIWPGHLLRGTQELFSGKPGIGKSQVQIDLVARATIGDGWPDGARGVAPMNVIMLTAEDSLDQQVMPRLRAADANLARIRFLVSIKRDTNGDRMFLLGEDLEDLERAIIDWGDVGLVTIDPITAFMGYGRFDARRVTDVRSQLSPLKELAEKMNVAFSTITHPRRALVHERSITSSSRRLSLRPDVSVISRSRSSMRIKRRRVGFFLLLRRTIHTSGCRRWPTKSQFAQ